jgi:hypothetical protein
VGIRNGTKTLVVIRTALAWISQLDQRTVKNLLFFAGSFTESAVSLSFGNNQNPKFFDSDFFFKKFNWQFFGFNTFKN